MAHLEDELLTNVWTLGVMTTLEAVEVLVLWLSRTTHLRAARPGHHCVREDETRSFAILGTMDGCERGRARLMADATQGVATPEQDAFWRDGYVVLRGFSSRSECEGMLSRMSALIDEWEPTAEHEKLSVFRTDSEQEGAQGSDDYFLSSADKVRFFLEPGAADEATGALRPGIQKATALNKVGHALHELIPEFREYAQSSKVQNLVRALGLRSPDLVQSMYIFKQPRIGALVTPHQDSCFLRTEPLSCVGLWLALERADESNGCLWARPGSHVEPLRRHFARDLPVSLNPGGLPGAGKMSFVWMPGSESAEASKWEGGLPAGVAGPADLGFVPVIAEAGDLVVIHGQVECGPHMPLQARTRKTRRYTQSWPRQCGWRIGAHPPLHLPAAPRLPAPTPRRLCRWTTVRCPTHRTPRATPSSSILSKGARGAQSGTSGTGWPTLRASRSQSSACRRPVCERHAE